MSEFFDLAGKSLKPGAYIVFAVVDKNKAIMTFAKVLRVCEVLKPNSTEKEVKLQIVAAGYKRRLPGLGLVKTYLHAQGRSLEIPQACVPLDIFTALRDYNG